MNCKNCNAVMRVDHEKKVFRCPYCDSEEPFDGVSKAALQGMLRDAIVDVRKESFNEAKKTLSAAQSYKDTRTKGRKVWDGIVLILQALLCVILGICCIGFFIDYVGLGFVSLIQLGLMIAIILWISAIASAFVDNIPFAATMIPVIRSIFTESDMVHHRAFENSLIDAEQPDYFVYEVVERQLNKLLKFKYE